MVTGAHRIGRYNAISNRIMQPPKGTQRRSALVGLGLSEGIGRTGRKSPDQAGEPPDVWTPEARLRGEKKSPQWSTGRRTPSVIGRAPQGVETLPRAFRRSAPPCLGEGRCFPHPLVRENHDGARALTNRGCLKRESDVRARIAPQHPSPAAVRRRGGITASHPPRQLWPARRADVRRLGTAGASFYSSPPAAMSLSGEFHLADGNPAPR
jgi:hypothetical protein